MHKAADTANGSSHEMHLEHVWRGPPHTAQNGLLAQPLMRLKPMTAAEPIVHAIHIQHVNLRVTRGCMHDTLLVQPPSLRP
jgi:hypothetical protein